MLATQSNFGGVPYNRQVTQNQDTGSPKSPKSPVSLQEQPSTLTKNGDAVLTPKSTFMPIGFKPSPRQSILNPSSSSTLGTHVADE